MGSNEAVRGHRDHSREGDTDSATHLEPPLEVLSKLNSLKCGLSHALE